MQLFYFIKNSPPCVLNHSIMRARYVYYIFTIISSSLTLKFSEYVNLGQSKLFYFYNIALCAR